MTHPKLCVFDAYGTLFDVHASASRYKERIGPHWERLSQVWRAKHLEYTWVHSLTRRYVPFWTLAQRSLDYAIAAVGPVSPEVRALLLKSYRTMDAYPEVQAALTRVRAGGAKVAILSNGDADMLRDLVQACGFASLFDAVLSVQDAGIFKPDKAVYTLVLDHFGCGAGDVHFFSSNRWDVAGAHAFGFKTVWVNRHNAPDEYPDMGADRVVTDLQGL